ncbi:MAG: tetratricopeptide repeat protein, partial [Planctomycetes bacterium]|nr:tetratricopeptide repeat protein [Planctomycetota bacterium]
LDFIERHPKRTHARATLANLIYFPQRRVDEAVDQLKRAVEIRPDATDLHNDLAVAFLRTGNVGGALEEFETCARLAPDHPEPAERLAVIFGELRNATEADRWRVDADARKERTRTKWARTRRVRLVRWFVDHT